MATGEPIMPRTVAEFLRVAHALLAGAPRVGGDVYVVASTEPPLYRVQAVVSSTQEAGALLSREVDPALEWTTEEAAARVVFGPIPVPEYPFPTEVDPIAHPVHTDKLRCKERGHTPPGSPPPPPNPYQITGGELRIQWTDGGVAYSRTWEIPPRCDAIFLTRGAMEMFFYPHYETVFGHTYARAMRIGSGHHE